MATKRLENGSKIVNGKLVIDEDRKLADEGKEGDIITFEILKEIAEEVDPMLKFTIDTPSNHEDKKLPVLDIKVDINLKENQRLDYEFFEKPTKHPKVVLANSALSMEQKRTILPKNASESLETRKLSLGTM